MLCMCTQDDCSKLTSTRENHEEPLLGSECMRYTPLVGQRVQPSVRDSCRLTMCPTTERVKPLARHLCRPSTTDHAEESPAVVRQPTACICSSLSFIETHKHRPTHISIPVLYCTRICLIQVRYSYRKYRYIVCTEVLEHGVAINIRVLVLQMHALAVRLVNPCVPVPMMRSRTLCVPVLVPMHPLFEAISR